MGNALMNTGNIELEPINIFVTRADRYEKDLSKMSNFMDGYADQLSLALQRKATPGLLVTAPISDLGIIRDVVQQANVVRKGNMMLVPDFDNLPLDIKKKLKKRIYSIGESRQVDGNLRAVINDENGRRIKDITLKKVPVNQEALETSRNIEQQLQLRHIHALLADIRGLQQFQLEKDRDSEILTPFLNARTMVLEAEAKDTVEDRNRLLTKADDEMRNAISAIKADIYRTSIEFAKIAKRPFNNLTALFDTCMSFLVRDIHALNQ